MAERKKIETDLTQELRGQRRIAEYGRRADMPLHISQIYEEIAGSLFHGFAIMQDGKIVLANHLFAALADLTVNEIVGSEVQLFIHLVHPEDRPLVMSQLRLQSTADYVPRSFMARAVSKGGPDRWLEFYSNRTTYMGRPAFLTSVIDITERRQAEQARRESEHRFRSVAETAADAIVIANSDGEIEYWNRTAAEIFGYKRDEIMGKPISMLIPERMQAVFHGVFEQLILTESSRIAGLSTDMRAVKSDGSEFPVEVSHATWTSDDRRYFSVLLRDVTLARIAQRRLEAQSRLAAIGQLASGIAHDFNNIMGTVILQSEMLLTGPHLSPKDRERLGVIIDQSQRAASLTDQIMDFSHRAIVELNPINLVPFAKRMRAYLTRILPENIKVRLSIDDGSFIVNGGRVRLQQAFMNLGLNSRDAMPDGGEILIGLSRRTIRLGDKRPFREMRPGDWIRIQVSDSGEGIKPELLSRVFEPFFTTRPPGLGSGLGLAQVYGIVRQHDGFIDVHSRAGHGATFTIHLPAIAATPGEEEMPGEAGPAYPMEETILVIEEDASTRDAIGEILGGHRYDVLLASDDREAVALLEQVHAGIDLVLADGATLKMSMRELQDYLRDIGVRIPIIVMTGHPHASEDREQLLAKRLDWIQKPFSSDSLSHKVRMVLARA